ncbi:MAG: GHMP kinase [Candidatus Eiseniibacteriota bacterium]|nr:MAG: GHMP kinase [Candidatus Eisenbacteria bacterium]
MKKSLYRSRAPLRVSFCGGGTDVSPYPEERGGVVLSATINKYAYASLAARDDERITITSLDYDVVAKYEHSDSVTFDGNLDLVKAVIKRLGGDSGLDLFIHSDAPPGSGLGSSSTLVVALIGAFKEWLSTPLTDYKIAELAYQIERTDMKIAGGRQDQYAATFGGFNFIEFGKDFTVVNPLRIKPSVLNELEYRLLLCYTGETRLSAGILKRQTDSYVSRKDEVVRALDGLKEDTTRMKNALLLGKLDQFGELLHEAWLKKKNLDQEISSTHIDGLYSVAREHGAVGGKILGAGGGGYLLTLCRFDRKHIVAEKLEKAGGQIVEFGFEFRGLDTWKAE